ncbi:MAG: hypothetical protein AAGC49_14035 [Brevundimonas sp.]
MTTAATLARATLRPAPGRRTSVRAYLAIARVAARSLVAYRVPFLLSLIGSVLTFASLLYLWQAIIESGSVGTGHTWPQMRTYLLVGFVVGTIVSPWTDWRTAFRVLDGAVATDLTKPVDFQKARFAETAGFALVEVGVGLVVGIGVVAWFGGVVLPPPVMCVAFVVSMLFVLPLKFCLMYLFSLLCFWTQGYVGINWARLALTALFSGALLPLAVFPAWLQAVAQALPFQATVSTPALILLDEVHGAELWRMIAVQIAWTVALWWGARGAWRRASRQLTVHGG